MREALHGVHSAHGWVDARPLLAPSNATARPSAALEADSNHYGPVDAGHLFAGTMISQCDVWASFKKEASVRGLPLDASAEPHGSREPIRIPDSFDPEALRASADSSVRRNGS